MKQKIIYSLKMLIILMVAALTALIYFQQGDFTSLDLGRHLKNGQTIRQSHEVLFENFYSFTEPDFSFINHHWLSGVIFWLLYLIGGFKILTILNILLGVGSVLLILKLAARKSNFWLASILALPVILLLNERIDIRPEMFSYFFIALTYFLVEDFRANGYSKKLICFVPMFLLWMNLHIYFVVGLFLIYFALLEQLILHNKNFFKIDSAKKFFYITLLSWAVTLFNPNFIKGLIYPFNILKKYGYEIAENKSPFFIETIMMNYNIPIFKILLALLIISFIVLFIIRRKANLYYLILALIFSAFACLYIRNLPLFGIIILPIMAENYYLALRNSEEKLNKLLILILVLITYAIVFSFVIYDNQNERRFLNKNLGLGMNTRSLDSIKFFRDNNLLGPIFNNYDLGSALIFWLYPKEKVFVDNRPEAYSVDFFNQVYKPMQMDENKWLELSERYGINLIYFSHTDGTPWAKQFLAVRLKDENWPLIYFDNYTVMMVKNNEDNKALIKKYKIDENIFAKRINELSAGGNDNEKLALAGLALAYGRAGIAKNFYLKILEKRPEDAKILAAMGFLRSGGGSREAVFESISYLNKALDNGYKLPGVYVQLGLNYWTLLDYDEAKNMWGKALGLDSNNEHAKYYLNQANELIK